MAIIPLLVNILFFRGVGGAVRQWLAHPDLLGQGIDLVPQAVPARDIVSVVGELIIVL